MVISFMTIPNVIALLFLAPVVKKEAKRYFDYLEREKKLKSDTY
jgi:Na+/alanine symporter